jgi:hypothetical protein
LKNILNQKKPKIMNEVENNLEKQLVFTEEIKDYIMETAKWSKFLSILGFIFVGFMSIIGILMLFSLGGSLFSDAVGLNNIPGFPAGMFSLVGIIYFGIALLYFFPVYYLYMFARKTKNAILCNDNQMLAEGFSKLKSHYKFVGILTLIIVGFYAFMFFIGMVMFLIKVML